MPRRVLYLSHVEVTTYSLLFHARRPLNLHTRKSFSPVRNLPIGDTTIPYLTVLLLAYFLDQTLLFIPTWILFRRILVLVLSHDPPVGPLFNMFYFGYYHLISTLLNI
jgi:hypothetical protein